MTEIRRPPTSYDRTFYAGHASASRASAAAVLEHVADWLRPSSVLDVGCGVGGWLAEWRARGVDDVLGLDGDYVAREALLIPDESFRAIDLSQGFDLGRRFDLVESLEVAEHLDLDKADAFVEALVRHGDVILFSAALPGQGGTHHVNEQWLSYWAPKFETHGYELFDVLRPRIWDDERVEWWYRQNSVLFAKPSAGALLRELRAMPVLDVVHPLLWIKPSDPLKDRLLRALAKRLPAPARRAAKRLLRR